MYRNWIVRLKDSGDVWQVTTGGAVDADESAQAIRQLSEAIGKVLTVDDYGITAVEDYYPSSVVKLFDGIGKVS